MLSTEEVRNNPAVAHFFFQLVGGRRLTPSFNALSVLKRSELVQLSQIVGDWRDPHRPNLLDPVVLILAHNSDFTLATELRPATAKHQGVDRRAIRNAHRRLFG